MGTGALKKAKSAEDRILKRICLRDRFQTFGDIRREFVEHGGTEICNRTVRRRLRDFGLLARKPAKKPLLTKKMRQKRMQWALRHQNWTTEDWKTVIFSDESKFNLYGTDGNSYVWRRSGERFSQKCVRNMVRKGGSRMIWGCFSYYGVGQMHLIEGNVNGLAYRNILDACLLPSMESFYSEQSNLKFQDDSAPSHRSKIVKDYLHDVGISVLEWPGNSPDLNPIENLWHLMKVQVAQSKPKTLPELDKIIEGVWYEAIQPSMLQNLVNSMPDRIKAVIKNKGGPAKY